MRHLIKRQRPAMGTWFEVRLVGDDPEHLAAVADAVLDEVERVERLLSRFDRRSEIERINREAGSRPVLVDHEVLDILLACQAAWTETGGYFDVTASQAVAQSAISTTFANVLIDRDARKVRFTRPFLSLDLGGVGKGYALDREPGSSPSRGSARSSSTAVPARSWHAGSDESGRPWVVGVRDPFVPPEEAAELFRLPLDGRGFSCSATRAAGQVRSDVVDPRRSLALEGRSSCVVLADDATRAEILSTALLCMGKVGAAEYVARYAGDGACDVAWIDVREGRPRWQWLTTQP